MSIMSDRAPLGVPDVCPAWCVVAHAEVEFLTPGTDDGRTHMGTARRVGPDRRGVVTQVAQENEGGDVGPVVVDVSLEPRGDGVAPSPDEVRSLATALLRLADEAEALT